MKFYARKVDAMSIEPAGQDDQLLFEKWQIGQVKLISVKEVRNYENHKRFFALLQTLMEVEKIQEKYKVLENLRFALIIGAGYFTWVPDLAGVVSFDHRLIPVPDSISFEKMNEEDFQLLFSKCIDVALFILPEYCREDLDAMVDEVLRFG